MRAPDSDVNTYNTLFAFCRRALQGKSFAGYVLKGNLRNNSSIAGGIAKMDDCVVVGAVLERSVVGVSRIAPRSVAASSDITMEAGNQCV